MGGRGRVCGYGHLGLNGTSGTGGLPAPATARLLQDEGEDDAQWKEGLLTR